MALPLGSTRILVTNDDGVEAEGIAVLTAIAKTLSDDVWVVAPTSQQSGASHSLTLHSDLQIKQVSERCYAINGTPTDCVVLAVKEILKEKKPDLVLSGINRGANLGEDVTHSGTVAAAMEGTLLDIPSIGFSQLVHPDESIHWDVPEKFAGDIIQRLFKADTFDNILININFPHCAPDEVAGIRAAPQGKRKIGDNIIQGKDSDGNLYYRIGTMRDEKKEHKASDLAAIRKNFITLTPLCLDLTHYEALESLDEDFTCQYDIENTR